MQPLALAGDATAKSENAAMVHAMLLVMFFSERYVERLQNTIRLGKFRGRDHQALTTPPQNSIGAQ
jgi:hypothetical protein